MKLESILLKEFGGPKVSSRTFMTRRASLVGAACVAMTAYGVGLLVYCLVEKPVMHWLSERRLWVLRAKEFKNQH